MSTASVRDIFPDATITDRAALALFAWHSLVAEGTRSPAHAASDAFEYADAMLAEVLAQECWERK